LRYLIEFRLSWAQAGFALLAGALLSLANPPAELSWPGFVGLAVLIRLIWPLAPAQAWLGGLICGAILSLLQLHWIMVSMTQYGHVPWLLALAPLILFALVLGSFCAFWASITVYLHRRGISLILAAPIVWVLLEWMRGWMLTGFPWLPLAHVWLPVPALLQSAEIWGVFGLSGVVVLCNALLVRASLWPGKRPGFREAAAGIAAVALLTGAYVWGDQRMSRVQALSRQAPQLTVSSVQGNVKILDMWRPAQHIPIVQEHVRLSRELAQKVSERPWLIVWSESAAPFYMVSEAKKTQPMLDFARQHQAALLVGTMGSVYLDETKKNIGTTNRTFLVDAQGRPAGFYDKVHLVPFGEYVPWGYIFFWVRAIAAVSQDFSPGVEGSLIDYGPAKLGPLICYESIFPELARAQRRRGAMLMVNQTNDAWFGHTSASRQHMSHLALRSIENRIACVRSANSGVSGFVHPDGSITSTTGLFVQAAVTEKLPLLRLDTIYTAYGHLVGPLSLTLTLAMLLLAWLRSRKRN
jgi:apolipoprotein N-acyltransferase